MKLKKNLIRMKATKKVAFFNIFVYFINKLIYNINVYEKEWIIIVIIERTCRWKWFIRLLSCYFGDEANHFRIICVKDKLRAQYEK